MTETRTETPPFERVTISLPPDLVARIDAAATEANRSRSNFIMAAMDGLFRQSLAATTTNTSEQ